MFSEKHQHKIKKRQQILLTLFLSVDYVIFYSITLIDIFCN